MLEAIRRTAEFARSDPKHFAEYITNKQSADITREVKKLETMRNSVVNVKNFVAKAKCFTDMTELTPELLRVFVSKIAVYEKKVKYSKSAPQKMVIQFRDINIMDTPESDDSELPSEELNSLAEIPVIPA